MQTRLVELEVVAVLACAALLPSTSNVPRPQRLEKGEADVQVRVTRFEERVERRHLEVDKQRLRRLIQARSDAPTDLVAHRGAARTLCIKELLHHGPCLLRLLVLARLTRVGAKRGCGGAEARAPLWEGILASRLCALVDVGVGACDADAGDLKAQLASVGLVIDLENSAGAAARPALVTHLNLTLAQRLGGLVESCATGDGLLSSARATLLGRLDVARTRCHTETVKHLGDGMAIVAMPGRRCSGLTYRGCTRKNCAVINTLSL